MEVEGDIKSEVELDTINGIVYDSDGEEWSEDSVSEGEDEDFI